MGLNVGLVAAMLIRKRNPNNLTRLQTLLKINKERPQATVVLTQWPVKTIISILVVLSILIGSSYFR